MVKIPYTLPTGQVLIPGQAIALRWEQLCRIPAKEAKRIGLVFGPYDPSNNVELITYPK